jgi:selenocysteine lyase/cysteine desulfurase
MGLGLVYGGIRVDGDVVTTEHDFYATHEALRLRFGDVPRIRLYADPARATVDEIVSAAARGARPGLLAVTWVHSSTGVRLPVAEICAALAALSRVPRDQYVVCVAGVHGFSAVDVELPDLGCDFLAAGTHKWLFGPRGTGILWGRDWAPLTELIPSFTPDAGSGRMTAGGYHSFEHRWALADAFGFMGRIGRDRAVARTTEQATRLKEGLAETGVTLVTPLDPQLSAGIVCFDVPGAMPANAVLSLREAGVVASATPYRTSYTRLGPSIETDPDEVDAAVAAVGALA